MPTRSSGSPSPHRVRMRNANSVHIRRWHPTDDVPSVTRLLHQAYAPLAARGFRYMATHQDDEVTRRRLSSGTSFLAFASELLVGCVSVYPSDEKLPAEHYRRAGVFRFGQFAVHPAWQRGGIGRALFSECERHARANGAEAIACDTAEGANELIRTYERWGFRFVDYVSWPDTNYRSVLLSKRLAEESK